MEVARITGNVLVCWSALAGTLSVLVYARVPWTHTQWGRHLMAYMVAIALVLDLAVARVLFGDSTWFLVLRLVVFVAIPVVMTWRLVLLVKAQYVEDKRSPSRSQRGAPQ
jgi:hypothetical protein